VFIKLVRFHGADLVFTDAAVREIARISLERGAGAVASILTVSN
jgi:ATP-dependent protease Clp ATPase subunit